jgi:glutamate synthase domain-containing protein 1
VAAGPSVPRIAHNGEINTVTGKELDARPRGAVKSDVFGSQDDLEKLFPICTPGASDTARFDRCSNCCTSAAAAWPMRC